MTKFLKRKTKGVGGVLFIFVAQIMAVIFVTVAKYSVTSAASSICNDISHIICTKVAIYSYQANVDFPDGSSSPNVKRPGGNYNVIDDFENISRGYGFVSGLPSSSWVTWDSSTKVATLEFGELKTRWDATIKPQPQEVIIEDY